MEFHGKIFGGVSMFACSV